MKEKAVDINRVNLYSLPIIVLGGPLAVIVYRLYNGANFKEALYNNPSLILLFLLATVGMVLLHELIHGLFFALYAKGGFKGVSFGVMWKHFAPYCHCEESIKAWQYGIVTMMPTILLGIVPLLAGFFTGNFFVFGLGVMMAFGGMGDIVAFILLQQVPADTLVIDHSSKVGFYYEEG